MKMGACQFLRDFRRSFQLKKSSEHRKRVLQRQQAAAERMDAPSFATIQDDKSPMKRTSHISLMAYVQKYGVSGIQRVFVKQQITRLCRAYGHQPTARQRKPELASILASAVTSCEAGHIPYHLCLNDDLQSESVASQGHVLIRSRRV